MAAVVEGGTGIVAPIIIIKEIETGTMTIDHHIIALTTGQTIMKEIRND